MAQKKEFYSLADLAELMGVSRQAIFRKVQNGQIKAQKVGKSYIVKKSDLAGVFFGLLSDKLKKELDSGVARVIREYDDTLKLLGKE